MPDVFERGRKRSPKVFADSSVLFTREGLKRKLELARGFVRLVLLEVNEPRAIVHVGAFRIQLQRIPEIGESAIGLAGLTIKFSKRKVGVGMAGSGFDARGKVIFRIGLLGHGQVFAVTRTVIEPKIACELGVPVDRFSDPLSDCPSAERLAKCRTNLRSIARKI